MYRMARMARRGIHYFYRPDGVLLAEGELDAQGVARVEGLRPGTYKVTFQNLDREAWEPLRQAAQQPGQG